MKHHTITGGRGVQLHVVETGDPSGRPIVFIHGFSQCWLAWSRQLHSDLADRYRLVAMDLRGHGLSEKPRDGYADSRLWADDIDAVIQALKLDRPVLCGWSYGPLVMLDYLRHYGEEAIGGMTFVGGITKLGSEEANSVITPEFFSLVPGFFSADVEESVRSLRSLVQHVPHPETLGRGPVPHAGVQPIRPTIRPSGALVPLDRQRRSSADDPQARPDCAWRSGRELSNQPSSISTRPVWLTLRFR